jgi:hypothetical protein
VSLPRDIFTVLGWPMGCDEKKRRSNKKNAVFQDAQNKYFDPPICFCGRDFLLLLCQQTRFVGCQRELSQAAMLRRMFPYLTYTCAISDQQQNL